jgi:hypothetical protein
MTRDDREAVAQILALPDGPWDFAPGHATAADYFAAIDQAARYHVEIRERLPVVYHYDPRPPRVKPARPRNVG